jgi:tetratricopeptide (TPR) repeat protein
MLSMSPHPFRRGAHTLAALLLSSASLLSLGCGSSGALPVGRGAARAESVKPVDVRDPEFAATLYGLIRDGAPSAARDGRLVGVVRRQLDHAAQRFASGNLDRATRSVIGAMYLVRAGEGRSEMIDAAGERALAGAIERLSARGDEGRSLALMQMRAAALAPGSPARAELDQHMSALNTWMQEARTGKLIRKLGAEERSAVARALVDPSPQALEAAALAVDRWIDAAIEFHAEFRQTGERPAREDALEAARALESGGVTMAGIFLRHGDAKGAFEHLNRSSAKRLMPPELVQRIAGAAADDSARDWQAIAGAFAQLESERQDMETGPEPAVVEAALWGASLEAFRRDPKQFGAALLVARTMIDLGLSEGAPLVLAEGLGPKPEARALGAALSMLMSALGEDAGIGDIEAARRTFRAGQGILAAADQPRMAGRLDPAAAQVRFLMASIEVRAGHLTEARPLLEAAVAEEPSVSAFTTLALVERQAGEPKKALETISKALAAPDARAEIADVAEALLLSFEVHRDAGAQELAKSTLDRALSAALAARNAGSTPSDKARAERLLGRVLDGYGDAKGAARAAERALTAAAAERPILGPAVLDAVGRAFVRRDLAAARAALKHGLDADVPDEDLVYGGLWVLLLERELRAAPDGTAERALRAGGERGSWVAKLAAWANGKLSDQELVTAAQSMAQKVEVAFYTAMARKVAGDPAAEERLRAVAKSPVIDLLEVQLARDMVAPRIRADIPEGVKLP